MRLSLHTGKTLKDAPRDAVASSLRLLLRAGYLRQTSAGVYAYMPLLWRVMNKVSGYFRRELEAAEYEEFLAPSLQTRDLWKESGRWDDFAGPAGAMFSFEDRRGAGLCLGPSHEEVVLDMVRREISSYKHLPRKLFQIKTVFRDEVRPRSGLIRSREILMLESFLVGHDEDSGLQALADLADIWLKTADSIGLACRLVEAESPGTGEKACQDLIAPVEAGEDVFFHCQACSYAAAPEKAESRLTIHPGDEEEKPMEKVHGPGLIGVGPLAEFLGLPVWKTTKTLLFEADGRPVAVMVRGDCDVNETKVMQHLGAGKMKLASAEMVRELTGAEVGYAGPIGLPPDVPVLADHFTADRVNFECGANQTDHHNINVNFGRDFPWPTFGDFKQAAAGHFCPRCGDGRLIEARGTGLGRLALTGSALAEKMNLNYANRDGKPTPAVMAVGRLNIGGLIAALVEGHHDESGLVWPEKAAPFKVHLIALNMENEEVKNQAEKIYRTLGRQGVEVLFDDREARAGEKFGDADLMGLPHRLTLSKRTLKERKLEYKTRTGGDSRLLDEAEALAAVGAPVD